MKRFVPLLLAVLCASCADTGQLSKNRNTLQLSGSVQLSELNYVRVGKKPYKFSLTEGSIKQTLRGDESYFHAIKLPTQDTRYVIHIKSFFDSKNKGHFVSPQLLSLGKDKSILRLQAPEIRYSDGESGEDPHMVSQLQLHPFANYLLVRAVTGFPAEKYNARKIRPADIAGNSSLSNDELSTILVKSPVGEMELSIKDSGIPAKSKSPARKRATSTGDVLHKAALERAALRERIYKRLKLEEYTGSSLKDPDVKAFSAFIFTVLSNTRELRIHQMNGEIYNEVHLRRRGGESVYKFERDENGNKIEGTGVPVTDCVNKGSHNYFHPYKAPLRHFSGDMIPWFVQGNCIGDPGSRNPGSREQRVEAYVQDLREGHERALSSGDDFSLPWSFRFRKTGQSEAISFFSKALERSEFDFTAYYPGEITNPEKQEQFFQALEAGIKDLLENP